MLKLVLPFAAVVFGIKMLCYRKGIYFFGVDVRSWKKDVLANGKADKKAYNGVCKSKMG